MLAELNSAEERLLIASVYVTTVPDCDPPPCLGCLVLLSLLSSGLQTWK